MRDGLSDIILAWYDDHARKMPWRVPPAAGKAGQRPDPYRVWLSEVMLQQTTVAAVTGYFERFTTIWPDVAALAAAEDADVMAEWAGLGYYARARNLLKCARAVVTDHGGRFPGTREALLTLPGIGPYTASAIAAIAFDEAATVVDGNVERVMARLHDIHTPLPRAKPELTARAEALTPAARPGDYAQAVMDLGATICTPKSPACGICPWREPCRARAAGTAAELPRKDPRKAKPIRQGTAYVLFTPAGAVLTETRPDSGLLGGMVAFPSTDWTETPPPHAPPAEADWQEMGEARHTFTHFHLRLRVMSATTSASPDRGTLTPLSDFRPTAMPTLMRKVWSLARAASPRVAGRDAAE